MNSLVTVVIPCYNQAKYLSEAVQSVVKQTFNDFEIIIVDDVSPDDTEQAAKSLMSKYWNTYNISYMKMPKNMGATNARTAAIKTSRSEFILPLDADDKLDPTYLEKTVNLLHYNPDVAFAYTNTQHFGQANSFWIQPEYDFQKLLRGNYISYCSLIRRDAFNKVGGYDLKNRNYWEDYQLFLQLGKYGYYGLHIPERLFHYRVHAESSMQSRRNEVFGPVYKCYIISKNPEIYPVEALEYANSILSKYPPNFMSMTPAEQEAYL
jgi:glycosyltransferase involved in cell wall biosynthesis